MAVHVTDAPGDKEPEALAQVMAEMLPEPVKSPSLTVTFVRVTLPVLVTRKE